MISVPFSDGSEPVFKAGGLAYRLADKIALQAIADSGDPVAGDIKLLLVQGNDQATVTTEITSSP